ncbi:putative pentatricopeptide repeat-containing protein At3g13770, mitochondrial [Malania oleifera]|uniref:putative pentatricopeptide repeat-containing protein At3g13770, mitochondrial n=1 Tax=Malania oleifera TaxID=397392 RepID=UPI0025ADA7EC|nr:putative pentatricopeptide repeat-containing protein At3g13770, mitochondrial [Malania oleifera]
MLVVLRSLQRTFCSWHQPQSLAEKLSLLSAQGRLDEAVRVLGTWSHQLTFETYLSLIRSCIKFNAFGYGREIHRCMIEVGFKPNLVLQNNIVIMYSKCGYLDMAREVFEEMSDRNLFSWTAMIGAYSDHGDKEEAFQFYKKMVSSGIKADCFVYPMVLKSCAAMKDLKGGQCVHADVVRSGFWGDLVVMNSIVYMYAKCESMGDAEGVFNEMLIRDVFSWTTMLVAYVQAGHHSEALQLFDEMLHSRVRPTSATLAGILPLFSELGSLEMVRQIHGLVTVNGFQYEKYVGTALVDVYANCGSLGYGRLIFDRIKEKDISCWNIMIKRYAQANLYDEVIHLLQLRHLDGKNSDKSTWDIHTLFPIHGFLKMLRHLERADVRPSEISDTFLDLICENVENIKQARELLLYFRKSGCTLSAAVGSILIRMCSIFGEVETAREIFDFVKIKEPDCWNAMIACYAYNGSANDAFELFSQMRKNGVEPGLISWNAIIAGYVGISDFEAALEILSKMKWTNEKPDIESYNIIVPLIGSVTNLSMGKQLHSMMLRTNCAMSKFQCTALINMYGNCGHVNYAIKLFDLTDHKDLVSWNAIISCLAKNGSLSEASRVFHELKVSGLEANTITWTALVGGYAKHGLVDESLKHFREIQLNGLKPNSITIASILPACALTATSSHGRSIHCHIIRNRIGLKDPFVSNALLDTYIKCGFLEYSERIFCGLHRKDIVSWNIMIQGYVIHGKPEAALSFFDQMLVEGFHPDSITLVGVISACSLAGMVDEGWVHFCDMDSRYGIMPQGKHYACMVDLLGRAGLFEDVQNFISQMSLEPTASLWGALLSACKAHQNVEMAEFAAGHLMELQPENSENYLILSDIYAKAGRWTDFVKIKNMMAAHGVMTLSGCSWIEIGNCMHSFMSDYPIQDIEEELYSTLLHLMVVVFEEGYVLETNTMNAEASNWHWDDLKVVISV